GPAGGTCNKVCDATSDSCIGGNCTCAAAGKACNPGQRCTATGCVCDGLSCAGCCDNSGKCQTTIDATNCGKSGSLCMPCGDKESCVDGACTGCSDPGKCSTCCAGDTCMASDPGVGCALNGGACVACGINADSCAAGSCSCAAAGKLCAVGQRCTVSGCV